MDITKFFALLSLVVIPLTGCHSGTTKNKEQVASTDTIWSVRLDVSGGFAGIQRKLTLDQSGHLQATDIKAGRTESDRISGAELDKIEEQIKQLAASSKTANPSTATWPCADCIEYRLDATFEAQHYSNVSYSGMTSEPTYTDLLSRLSNLLKQTLNR